MTIKYTDKLKFKYLILINQYNAPLTVIYSLKAPIHHPEIPDTPILAK